MNTYFGRLFGALMLLLAAALPSMAQVTIADFSFQAATRTGAYGPFQLTASGLGGTSFTWTLEANNFLPAGISLSSAGVVSAANVQQTATSATFTVRATCAAGCSGNPFATRQFTINVVNAPTIAANVQTLPAGINNVPYSQNVANFFAVTGGAAPYRFSLQTPPPIGLSINTSNLLVGVPNTSPQVYNLAFQLTDANNVVTTASVSLPITITSANATISPTAVQNWTVNQPYLQEIVGQGGTGPLSYQITGFPALGLRADAKLACPSQTIIAANTYYVSPLSITGVPQGPVLFSATGLPAGYSLNPSTGVVSGFVEGSFTAQVQFTAQFSNGVTVGRTCNLGSTFTSGPPPSAMGCPLDYAVLNSPYFSSPTLFGNGSPAVFSLPQGSSLPPGLTLDSSGSIAGTATQTGLFPFLISATAGTVTQVQSCSVRVLSPLAPVSGGSFIYGLPTSTGTINISATLSGQTPPPVQNYVLTINPAPAFGQFTYPNGSVGSSYSSSLLQSSLSGGTPAFTYSLNPQSTPLPPGLNLAANGVISGIPTQVGTFAFTIRLVDLAGAVATAQRQIVIGNSTQILQLSPPSLNIGSVNVPYSATFTATGGSGSGFTYFVNTGNGGILPPGLTFSNTGLLQGTPTQTGTFNFAVTVFDSFENSATVNYSLQIVNFTCPTNYAPLGLSYSSAPVITGLQITNYSVSSGALPTGLALSPTNGLITGTPSAEGYFNPVLTATDILSRTVSRSCPISVTSVLQLRSPRTTGRSGIKYLSSVSVSGGRAPYIFAINDGALPPGLTLNGSTGEVSGSPFVAGGSDFRVLVTDADGRSTQRTFGIQIVARPSTLALRCPMPSAITNQGYLSFASISGNFPFAFRVDGVLPPGLSLNTATGQFSGIPTRSGTYTFNVFGVFPTNPPSDITNASCTIQVEDLIAPLRLACNDQEDLAVGEPYFSPLIATGGVNPISFQISDSTLPPGLQLNSQTGLISGIPTTVGNYNYYLNANEARPFSAFAACSVNIGPAVPLAIITSSLPPGQVGSIYSAGLRSSGGYAPVSWSIFSGSLPNGLTLNPTSGLISGQAISPGVFNFVVRVRDSAQQFSDRPFFIEISTALEPFRITTRSLNQGTVGIAYQDQVGATGGIPAYSFSLSSGTLPPGLSLTSSGAISGTPTTAGSGFRFTVVASDRGGSSQEATFTIPVFPGNFRLACPSAPAEVGAAYEAGALASGGSQPYSFSLAQGSLPAGLVLNAENGVVSGRPTTAGLSLFTLAVVDARTNRTQTLCSINVSGGNLRIISEDDYKAVAGVSLQARVDAAGGVGPYGFRITAGSLPPGLIFSPTGAITGIPTLLGNFPFTVEVRDAREGTATKSFTFRVLASNLSIACPVNLSPAYSLPFSDNYILGGGLAPIRVSTIAGELPSGLTLNQPDAEGRAALRGTPTLPGDYLATVRAVDSSETAVTVICRFRVTGELLQITTTLLGNGQQFTPYSDELAARGGVGAYSWSLRSGSLPDGLQLNSVSGSISGRPLRDGTFGFVVEVRDSRGNRAIKSLSIEVAPGDPPLIITTESPLSDAFVGRPYSAGFSVQGGKGPYTLSAQGLPDWLNFSGDSVSGTPQAAGSAEFSITARDANQTTTSKGFSIRVRGAASLRIVTASVPDGVTGENYSGGFTAEGGTPPLVWSIISGALPEGVSFDSSAGTLSGRPAVSGAFAITVQVTDSLGDFTRAGFEFSVRPPGVPPLEITTATLPDASLGTAYSVNFGARGGREPYTWSLNGDLLEGLSFNSSGLLSGNVQRAGTASFIATVSDSLGFRVSRTFTLRAVSGAPPALLIEGLPDSTTPNQTLPFTVRLASSFGVALTGRLTLVFVPDPIHGADDAAVRFGNTTRSIDFSIPANSTQIQIPAAALSVASGTLAGTIRVDSSLTAAGVTSAGPSRSITLGRRAPVISAVRLTRSGSNLEIRIEGFVVSRRLSEARITFTAASGVDLTTSSQVTVNVQAAIQAWFATAAASQFGGQFALVLPFTVNGDAANITGVSVVISNEDGTSNTGTAN